MALLGRIAAGRGLEAVAFGGRGLLAGSGAALGAFGEAALSPAGRRAEHGRGEDEDGDLLVVEEDEAPADGAVVVALLGGGDEVTVKRLYREGEMLRLRPENGGHEEIVVPAEVVRIQGRVIYVVHPPRRGPSGDGS